MSDEDVITELQEAAIAYQLNLRAAMKEIHSLTVDQWIDGQSMSMSDRLERIELIAEKALHG
jgi:hypothetical protein